MDLDEAALLKAIWEESVDIRAGQKKAQGEKTTIP